MPGTLFVVATPIGNLDDLSARALRTLRGVAVIAAEDTRRTARLAAHYGIGTPITSLHEHNEAGKAGTIVARLARGDDVALVSDAGTPGVSDPGRRLVRAALDAGIPVVPIPGASAVVTALSASGFPADTFTFLGFPPVRSKDRKAWFESLRTAGRTVVFFEAPHRIRRTLQEMLATVGDIELVLTRELTKKFETLVNGPISVVLDRLGEPVGEYTGILKIGQLPDIEHNRSPEAPELALEFSQMTKHRSTTRRMAVARLARKYGLSANAIYAAIEKAKKSPE